MRLHRSSWIGILLVGSWLACASAHAQGPGPGGPPEMGPGPRGGFGPGGPPPRWEGGPPPGPGMVGLRLPPPELLDRLGLSEAQRAKIEDLVDAERRKAIRAEADLRMAELDLQKLVDGDRTEPAAIDEAIDRITAQRTAMLRTRVETLRAIRAVLTPSQRAKLRRPGTDSRWH